MPTHAVIDILGSKIISPHNTTPYINMGKFLKSDFCLSGYFETYVAVKSISENFAISDG